MCEVSIADATLQCGHSGTALCSGTTSKCDLIITTTTLGCGHVIDIHCGEDSEMVVTCQEACNAVLGCGHACTGKCHECNTKHKPCSNICGILKVCGHKCKSTCHHGESCLRTCPEPCRRRCEHGPCKNRCSDDCDPCLSTAVPNCEHEAPTNMLCCLPSLTLPCDLPCPLGESS
jgi:hypothetical protein